MTDRDKLSGYPCTYYAHPLDAMMPCDPERALDKTFCASCPLQPIYCDHIKLRDDMRRLRNAVLVGSLTAHMSAEVYRGVAIYLNRHGCDGTAAHFDALADMVAKLDA